MAIQEVPSLQKELLIQAQKHRIYSSCKRPNTSQCLRPGSDMACSGSWTEQEGERELCHLPGQKKRKFSS